jgi:acyl carrier protein
VAYLVPEQPSTPPCEACATSTEDEGQREPGIDRDSESREKLIDRLDLFLKWKLPAYMVPSAFVMLEELPLSPNGKVDRDALPEPGISGTGIKIGTENPRTPLEEKVEAVFAEKLKLERVGIYDNFFDLGGHSLLATQVIAQLNEIFQVQLSQIDLLAEPTVAGLAERINKIL